MSTLEWIEQAKDVAKLESIRSAVREGGYALVNRMIEDMKEQIKTFEDSKAGEVNDLLAGAQRIVPQPGDFSPSWERVWDQLYAMFAAKESVLKAISPEQRDGEWQVIIDNPHTNQDVVCYPGLSFLEAAYLYGYFRPELEKNEYIRLQRIETLIMDYGQ